MQESTLLNLGPISWLLLALLIAAASLVWRLLLGRPAKDIVFASVRALLQLAIVALLISQLSGHLLWSLAFVLLMFVTAVWTAGRRIAATGRWWLASLPIAAGVLPVTLLMFASGVLPFNSLAVIAVIGQQIGGAMSTTTVAGRRIEAELQLRSGEVEAAVALGFTWSQARRLIAKPVSGEAVLPSIDQARTAGTVTLPGAFVGLILGGASPIAAGQVQLLVLISLLLVNSLAAWMCLLLAETSGWRNQPRP
ncbi:ABC transporter permease [Psychromicrobium lacuslunae]|uniref:ABC transporter permease n=1 Tax=Psychromicrobium lacuslunae TaxID=1618207 RepID=UPI000ABCA5C3|nr:ABC transporter permease [Psychromicrobium lacuslunae]